jgi:serine protease Do/serine protease DegQ
MNGKPIKSFLELRAKIGSIGVNKKVKLTVIRDGDKEYFTVKLKKDESNDIASEDIHRMLGGAELKNDSKQQAIIIEEVAQGSPAQLAGLKAGDKITGVNRTRIKTISQLRKFLKDKTGVLALNIIRDDHSQYIMIR